MKKRTILQFFLGGLCCLSMSVACGSDAGVGNDGAQVGGACMVASDCDEFCLSGSDYPQGTCSVSCNTDENCPGGTHCIDKEGGRCLLACELPSDCRGGYTCKGKTNNGHGGESLVCFKD